jgi:archaellum component FlaF (FlaF/FlaG flagellin family)
MKQILFIATLVFFGTSINAQADKPTMKKEGKAIEVAAPAETVTPTAAPPTFKMAGEGEKSNAKMTFESMAVDYGTVSQNSEPLRLIKFTNTGSDPLVIKNARGSCGCTVPNWPKDPILPGQSSSIEVRYDTNRIGKINKSITITTNEGDEPHMIQVIGEIMKADEQSVPPSSPNIIKGN